MNITQILLGTTAALLLAALVFSYTSMQDGVQQNKLSLSAKELMEENKRLEAELIRMRTGRAPAVAAQPIEAPKNVDNERMRALEEQNKLLKEKMADEEKRRKQAEEETLAMNERHAEKYDKESRRARLIEQAMIMAQIKEVAREKEDGPIQLIVLEARSEQGVRVGTELAIRRGTGIVGRVQVSNIDISGNIFADPLPGTFPGGDMDLKVGDELIVPPL